MFDEHVVKCYIDQTAAARQPTTLQPLNFCGVRYTLQASNFVSLP